MSALVKVMATMAGLLLAVRCPAAWAEEMPIRHFINLGTVGNELIITPAEVTLRVGETYQFVVSNPSEAKHVVSAAELLAATKTAKLVTLSPSVEHPAASLKAGVSVQPGAMMEWTFTPNKVGTYKFGCDTPAHAVAGMHMRIRVIGGSI
jgi:uncharacterized cupredoxin-like copper-binding protein